MFASKTTRGFYDAAIHGDNMPADVVEITAEEHAAMMDGQSNGKLIDFDEAGRPFLADPIEPTRAEKEARAWDGIKAERDRRTQDGGFHVGPNWFHSDTFSRTQHIALVTMGASIPAGLQWKAMSGEFVAMTPALAGQIFTAGALSDQAIFVAAETHRAAMVASEDPSAYDFSAGWPAVFGEVE